ncbi:cytochrome P450 [Aquibium sp. LZ166]|uniref:Cytochrome P450 n=1 Tax=Aquibium pacificus TaxID=3153579 RepID=A0ABV3SEF0_9HYPH
MFTTKFFDGVKRAQAAQKPVAELPPFDAERMRSKGLASRAIGSLVESPRWWLALLRRYRPIPRIGNFALVTKAADVREVFERQDVFQTPFGPEMAEMAGGANFILGMQDGCAYRTLKSSVLSAFPPDEVESRVRPVARNHAQAIMRGAMPGFDAVGGLLKLVPVRICREYFGMIIEDEEEFADWSIALSALFFSDPSGDATTRELAVVAAHHMRREIDRSIDRAIAGDCPPHTPLARLVAIHQAKPEALGRDDIKSVMMGMISGFAPTNLLAAANGLDVLLSRKDAYAAVRNAVRSNDDAALDRAILETMRFKPIFIGPFRYVARDTVIAQGTWRERKLKAGMTIMPSILSAMFDEETVADPERFNPDRPAKDYMVYGHGIHWCIGSAIAKVQIAECMRALFERPGLRRAPGPAGRLKRRGAFPESLHVDFDVTEASKTVGHAFVTIAARVREGVDAPMLRDAVDRLGNPATDGINRALDATGIVHFASLSVIGSADPVAEKPGDRLDLVLEFSADGERDAAIAAVAEHAGADLRPIFEAAGALRPGADFTEFMRGHAVDVAPGIHKAAGLCFTGTPGHSVHRIKAECAFEETLRHVLFTDPRRPGESAGQRLARLRETVLSAGGFEWAFQRAPHGLEGPERTLTDALSATLKNWKVWGPAAVLCLALAALFFGYAFGPATGFASVVLMVLASLVLALMSIVVVVAVIVGAAYLALRKKEDRDAEKGVPLPPERFAPIADRENHHAHNHLVAISMMKPGLLRRLTLRLAFAVIKGAATHAFPPGRLSDIGSIHYARWVLLPGTDKLLFFSNYGGSWGSYLEDFITKASAGLTGVWSNTLGYPKTRNLFQKGAENGDLFKHWAREQQIPTLFWYSAYPKLTTFHVRKNAAIRAAFASADSDSEAAALFSEFGSSPRPAEKLENEEIQAIFFGGMGRLGEAEMMALSMPEDLGDDEKRRFLDHVLANATFGDRLPDEEAMVIALAAGGLRKLGLDGESVVCGLPTAFVRGMAAPNQDRVLGDIGESASANWLWGGPDRAADAVVVCYARTKARLRKKTAAIARVAKSARIVPVARQPLTIRKDADGNPIEHFGFRDGISQPVIDGTPRARAPGDQQHRVAAGEFLLGYADQSGYVPRSLTVDPASDPDGYLAGLPSATTAAEDEARRDFGRNGSFLVVRDLVQHVDRFEDFCREAAAALGSPEMDGRPAEEWIAAKMFGRWKDGSSLVRNPRGSARKDDPSASDQAGANRRRSAGDNGFLFGKEDPQGLRCPFGSHVRRSNPRDSLGTDAETQIGLSKRHRILRISRAWENGPEKGILFMCLNADIERQFEFVQQTWVMNPNFNGLRAEQDPLVGNQSAPGSYTIPTPDGPLTLQGLTAFVTVKGGGYFFMPGRRSLRYLRALAGEAKAVAPSTPGPAADAEPVEAELVEA